MTLLSSPPLKAQALHNVVPRSFGKRKWRDKDTTSKGKESPEKLLNEIEESNLLEKEFRVWVIQFINWMGKKINNLSKNKEEVKNDIAIIKTQWNVLTVD